jgi:hypothetical protein
MKVKKKSGRSKEDRPTQLVAVHVPDSLFESAEEMQAVI